MRNGKTPRPLRESAGHGASLTKGSSVAPVLMIAFLIFDLTKRSYINQE